jgi:hypothetical protein
MQAPQQIANFELSTTVERITAAGGLMLLAGGSAVVAAVDPAKASFLPVCPLFELTGFACPGCGLTRGFHALFHGDIMTALDFNALIPVWAVILFYVFVSLALLVVRGRGLRMWPTAPKFLWTFMIVLVVFGVIRNIPAYPFTVLFP